VRIREEGRSIEPAFAEAAARQAPNEFWATVTVAFENAGKIMRMTRQNAVISKL